MNALVSKMNEARQKSRFWNSRNPEYLVLLVFFILTCTISAFHEPWFDEAQSWQIAKCESIGRLLFYIPHYEGNPPLWYLILALPAKLGVPFEWGLKSVGLIISLFYVILLEFKSPFPRLFKLILPFTYFFFYQYGIIVRPYGLMILAFILTALCFKERNTKPWRFVLCLAFLCETSSFCVAIAGGIAACWLFEILQELGFSFKKLFKDSRIRALSALLIFAVILAITVLPASDASFTNIFEHNNSVLECLLLGLTTFLSEVLIITSPWFSNDQTAVVAARIAPAALIVCIVIQLIIYVLIYCFSSKKNLKYFFVPYFCFCLFGALAFLGGHHLGIGYFVLFFWLWINFADDRQFENGRRLVSILHVSEKDVILLKRFSAAFCVLSVAITLFWSASSSWKDIRLEYSYGRETTRFLKETGLINAKIAASWSDESSDSNTIDYAELDLKSNGWPVSLCAYADRNFVYNFNDGLDNAAYVQFIKQTAEQNRETIERWKSYGVPDVLLGDADVRFLTDGAVSIKDYTPVYKMKNNYIWKGNVYRSTEYIFARNDLLDDYSLCPIERPEGMFGYYGIEITDEIRERFENGEDINDILKPYLDYIFGEESDTRG